MKVKKVLGWNDFGTFKLIGQVNLDLRTSNSTVEQDSLSILLWRCFCGLGKNSANDVVANTYKVT